MKRDVFFIITCICCILIPIVGLLYGMWDIQQPKIGVIGNGKPSSPSIANWISIGSCFFIGVINLPLAIVRYKKRKAADVKMSLKEGMDSNGKSI